MENKNSNENFEELPFIAIQDDFDTIDFEHDNIERYELTECEIIQSDYEGIYNPKEDGDFKDWVRDNLSFEELYEVPMMNCLYYYPSFCSFTEEDRQKTSGATTLLYDNELDRWAVGMTGGGMDLSPHLADTFIKLKSCIPSNIAHAIRKNYNAYVKPETHQLNCRILAKSFIHEAQSSNNRAEELDPSVKLETLKRLLKQYAMKDFIQDNEKPSNDFLRSAKGLLKIIEKQQNE